MDNKNSKLANGLRIGAIISALCLVLLIGVLVFLELDTAGNTQPEELYVPEATIADDLSPTGEDIPETQPTAPEVSVEETKPVKPEPVPEATDPSTKKPEPTEPKPTEPKPSAPAPTEPKPTEPAPTEPKPTEPAPTEPKPTEPAPTEPVATEPEPTEPEQDDSITVLSGEVSAQDGTVTQDASFSDGDVSAQIPAGVQLEADTTTLVLTITEKDSSDSGVALEDGQVIKPLDVHIEGISQQNTQPVTVCLGKILPNGMNIGNVTLYHVENGTSNAMTQVLTAAELDTHNEFYYDPVTGDTTVAMATFSEVAVVSEPSKWENKVDHTWYDANATELTIANADQLWSFSQIVGGMAKDADGNAIAQDSFSGKTIKLTADVNLNDAEASNDAEKIFYPIGYNSDDGKYEKTGVAVSTGFYTFEGTFDGQGHTISNFYQNTWEMKGDHNWYDATLQYYRDGMGLFGKIYGGTVKNLTVDNFSSDGEITTTGTIAAYADCGATFENIAITNCNPRVYNIGNGGIVGCVGWYTKDVTTEKVTFKNITVDNSNKISALWGSYDVACGGLVGQYYPTSGQTEAIDNAGISMENCHVAAQIDVYNDVCANYQYYAYRYAGMLIGSVRENVTENGHSYPNMDGITASGCTVHFGDWNDYYYCELVANSLASYTHDHQFSRLEQVASVDVENMKVTPLEGEATDIPTSGRVNYVVVNVTNDDGTFNHATESATCYHFVDGKVHSHDDYNGDGESDYETVNGESILVENNRHIYLEFDQLITGYGWGVTSKGIGEMDGVTILDRDEGSSVEKFVTKFTGDFLYRVGNKDNVPVSALFAENPKNTENKVQINDSGVYITIDKLDDSTNVSGKFNPADNWEDSTITFSGTGPVKVTIQDYDYCEPTVLYLEVVDAKNSTSTTSVTSATTNNVVLLNDTSGTFTVSNGWTFYGNGFKVTCSGNGSYGSKALSYGFVTVENGGILDNVQIICDIFPASYLYTAEMTADSSGRYPYAYSAVAITDNSTISNCYIKGARNNIFVGSGNVTIENTVTECGSLSNIHIKSSDAYTVTLDDVTTIQYQTTSPYDTSKKVLGFGVVVGDNESTSNAKIKLTGDLKQYNWVTDADKSVSNTYAKTAITEALKVTAYQHTINNTATVNMGIAYLNALTASITDERDNKSTIPYALNNITMSGQTGQVYSISGSGITADSRYNATTDGVIPYSPVCNRVVLPTVVFTGTQSDALTFTYAYDAATGGWLGKFIADLDNVDGGSYTFDFSSIKVQKYGQSLPFTAKDADGNAVTTVSLGALFTGEYTLEITDNLFYDTSGNQTGESVTHVYPFVINATKTSIEPPKFTNAGTATAIRLVTSSGGDWRPAYTALTGVSVTYWSASESKVKTVDLSTLYNSGTFSSNVWTYTCNDYTLTITGGAVHSDGSVITPVVANNTLYFASTNKAFGTGTTSRSMIMEYVFTDKNASTTWKRSEAVTYSELSEYDYNSFKNNGTLTEPSSGSGCLAPNTLITLADGTQVRVDALTGDEELLVWNLETGSYDTAPIVFVDTDAEAEYEVVNLHFSDGSEVGVIYEHGFFDYDLGKYVYLDASNAENYIGHTFVTQGDIAGNTWNTATLTDVVIETKVTTAYSPVSFSHLCYYTDGMLSMPGGIDGLFNIFDVDTTTMAYDAEKKAQDIETYGLYTYEDFADLIPEEAFYAFNGAYLKVAIGKGLLTWEDIEYLAQRYVPLM